MNVRDEPGQEFVFAKRHQDAQATSDEVIELKGYAIGKNLPHRDRQQDIGEECLAFGHLVTSKRLFLPHDVIARMVGAEKQESGDWAVAKLAGRFFIDGSDVGLLWRSIKGFVVGYGLTRGENSDYALAVGDTQVGVGWFALRQTRAR